MILRIHFLNLKGLICRLYWIQMNVTVSYSWYSKDDERRNKPKTWWPFPYLHNHLYVERSMMLFDYVQQFSSQNVLKKFSTHAKKDLEVVVVLQGTTQDQWYNANETCGSPNRTHHRLFIMIINRCIHSIGTYFLSHTSPDSLKRGLGSPP